MLNQPKTSTSLAIMNRLWSAHILWTKPLSEGGLVGAPLNNSGYDVGEAYEYQFAGSLVINGVLYFNQYPSSYANAAKTLCAVDIRTGQLLWTKPGVWMNRGQLLDFSTENQHGTFAYIWARNGTFSMMGASGPWCAYDAMTGDWMYTMSNVPSGTIMTGLHGEMLILVVNQANGWMALWNSSAIPALRGGAYGTWLWNQWRPWGLTIDAQASCAVTPETPAGISGYSWNVTIPKGLPGSIVTAFPDDLVYGYSRGASVINQVTLQTTPTDQFYAWAVSLKPESRGTLLWNKTEPLPSGNITITAQFGPQDAQSTDLLCFPKRDKTMDGLQP